MQIKHSNCQEQAIEARASLKLSKHPEGQDKVQINYILFRCVRNPSLQKRMLWQCSQTQTGTFQMSTDASQN